MFEKIPNYYSLILVSSLLSIILGTFIFFYVKVKQKKINFLFILILISLLPIISIFRPGSYESSDLTAHVTLAISFFKSLTDGVIIPRWGMDLNYTYGYPAFLFIYLLPYFCISFFHFFGISFLLATKLIYALSFVLSGITMYYFVKSELSKLGGFIAAVFYLYAPYHLVDLHFRADLGEIVAFVFLPLFLLFIKHLFENQKFDNFLKLSICFGLLILSHPAISLGSLPIAMGYITYLYFVSNQKRKLLSITKIIFSLIVGLLLTAFYWFPIINEVQFTYVYFQRVRLLFPNIFQFIFSPWGGGFLFQGHKGELSFIIGYTQVVLIVITPFFLNKLPLKRNLKIALIGLLVFFAFYFLLMQQFAQPLWYVVPFIKNFQFSYRLLGIIMFLISFIAAIVLSAIENKKLTVIILVFIIMSTILNWGNRKTVPTINENYILANVPRSDINFARMGQAIPKWISDGMWELSYPKNHLEIISGNASIVEKQRKTNRHDYLVRVYSPTILQENTWYFPGWKAYDNGTPVPMHITSGKKPGLIQFSLSQGTHNVSFIFTDTRDRQIGNFISLATISFLSGSLLLSFSLRVMRNKG